MRADVAAGPMDCRVNEFEIARVWNRPLRLNAKTATAIKSTQTTYPTREKWKFGKFGICAFRKAHMHSTPMIAFETVPVFVFLTVSLSRPLKEDS